LRATIVYSKKKLTLHIESQVQHWSIQIQISLGVKACGFAPQAFYFSRIDFAHLLIYKQTNPAHITGKKVSLITQYNRTALSLCKYAVLCIYHLNKLILFYSIKSSPW